MKNELYHHGVKGQSWGTRHGPPYPLDSRTTAKKYLQKELKAVKSDIEKIKNTKIDYSDRRNAFNRLKNNCNLFDAASRYEKIQRSNLESIMDMPMKEVSKLSKNPKGKLKRKSTYYNQGFVNDLSKYLDTQIKSMRKYYYSNKDVNKTLKRLYSYYNNKLHSMEYMASSFLLGVPGIAITGAISASTDPVLKTIQSKMV